jgi:hypothetical protein
VSSLAANLEELLVGKVKAVVIKRGKNGMVLCRPIVTNESARSIVFYQHSATSRNAQVGRIEAVYRVNAFLTYLSLLGEVYDFTNFLLLGGPEIVFFRSWL